VQGYSQSTANLRVVALRIFYRYLVASRLRRRDPTDGLAIRPVRRVPKRPYSEDESRAVVDAARNARDRAILYVLMDGALRLSEVAGIVGDDIDWAEHRILVHGKGLRERWIALGETTMAALRTCVNGQRGNVWGIDAPAIYMMVTRAAQRAGLQGIHPHGFRRTFAIRFAESSGDIGALQVILGHNALSQTLYYAGYAVKERALDAQRRFSPVDRL
jgi:site-specific recombinase XerC